MKRLLLVLLMLSVVRGTNARQTPSRPKMGFAFYPTVFMIANAEGYVENFTPRADLISIHWDAGVPWDVLAACSDLQSCQPDDPTTQAVYDNLQTTIPGLLTFTEQFRDDPAKRVYLALNPLNIERTGLSPNYLSEAPSPATSLGETTAREAYKRFVRYMVATFQPDYFSPGIEFTMYARGNPADFEHLLSLLAEIKVELAADYPEVIVSPTIQWEIFRQDFETHPELATVVSEWGVYSDLLMLSTYPNLFLDQTSIDPAHYDFAAYGFAPDSEVFFSEIGTQPELQSALLDTLFGLNATVVGMVWFFLEDGDHLPFPPGLQNNGLYNDANGLAPNPGLSVWDGYFTQP